MLQIHGAHNCVVCSKPTNSFNYGVHSCNACVMFFRRIVNGHNPIRKPCKTGGNCWNSNFPFENLNFLNCRQCRFQKCLQAGMTKSVKKTEFSENCEKPTNCLKILKINISTKKHTELTDLINNLLELDTLRNNRLINFQVLEDPNIDEVIEHFHNLKFLEKPENLQFTTYDWGFFEQICTIDFLRNLEIAKYLDMSDLKILIKNSYFKTSLIINGYRSMIAKSEEMKFPDGTDVLPELLINALADNFLINIRSRLVGRLIELKITKEEFLLLSVVLFLDSGIPSLSPTGRTIINSYQSTYSSALINYCLINYQQSAPSRFIDLLSVCHVINTTFRDFCHFTFMVMMNSKQPVEHPKRVVQCCLKTDSDETDKDF